MRYSHLLSIQKEAGLSPEQLAERLGISGMSLRRWRSVPGDRPLPKLYANALTGVVLDLIAEGKLPSESEVAQAALLKAPRAPFNAIASHLGLSWNDLKGGRFDADQLVESLSKIGLSQAHQDEVSQSKTRIFSFKAWGQEWGTRISSLWTVLVSRELSHLDKWVAYGALFYLITPFDLIPDAIPVFGYMDDFLILGVAAAYYLRRFPRLFKS